jgi:hypothetical protein
MKEFMLLFRQSEYDYRQLTPNEMETINKKWQEWTNGIDSQGKLVTPGTRLSFEGKVLKPGGLVTDGPFVEIRERLGGFMVVRAENIDEATTLAHGCPALDKNGSVEIRPFFGM